MLISLQVRTLFILFLFSYPEMIIGNRPKLREDLSHVGFKSPHDFLEKKKQTSQKKTGYSLSDNYTYLSSSRTFRS